MLDRAEVQVWHASLEHPAERLAAWRCLLVPEELERASRFVFERDARRFIASRGILRELLAGFSGERAHDLRLSLSAKGKPALKSDRRLCFNLAHSHERAVFAFSWNRELGIDIEQIRPVSSLRALAAQVLTERERQWFQALPPACAVEAFLLAWTRKEAYLKWTGEGLAGLPLPFDIPLGADQGQVIEGSPPCRLENLARLPGYVGTLAATDDGWQIVNRTWRALTDTLPQELDIAGL
jgi:4'-phosphopantetheinyl transferase